MRVFKIEKSFNVFTEHLEDNVIDQFKEAFKEPFNIAGALMPDAHYGYTLPIGSVIESKGIVVPAYVGYDIGCGMSALKLKIKRSDLTDEIKQKILKEIIKNVPVGRCRNHTKSDIDLGDLASMPCALFSADILKENIMRDIGTLGGGNHFIEIGYDEYEHVWIVVHSGSRGLGHKIATEYMKKAYVVNTGIECKSPKEGSYGFKDNTTIGQNYIQDLMLAQRFALMNRELMIKRSLVSIKSVLAVNEDIRTDMFINRNHNHAEYNETNKTWIHRKGATQAHKGMYGVIPGNMKDGSFIVIGKGNPDSLQSSSHGAGRILSRTQAFTTLDTKEFEADISNIVCNVSHKTLDESPKAYKDIFTVMEEQKDLVDIVHHIKPLINIKG